MHLLPGSLLELTGPDGQQEVLRVVHIDGRADSAHVIRLGRPDAMPEPRSLSELETGIATRSSRILTADPFAHLQRPEETIPEKHRQRRDAAWAIIAPIVTAPDGGAFVSEIRGRLIREAIARAGGSKKHIYRHLRRYWQAGMTPNALLPNFFRCGAPGSERKAGAAKRGRPRRLAKLTGLEPGINVGPDEAEKLRKGYRTFFEKAPEDGGLTKRTAYERTLQKFFHRGFELRSGVMVPVLPPAGQLPSYKQFEYWGRKATDFNETLIRRQGQRRFNLKSRAVLGDATLMAFGPGSQLQIDSTPSDIWVVSALDRSRRLGRPTMYFVVDTFSHLITGFYAGLDDPSFFAAGLALENATLDKVVYCAQFGITISAEEWPSCGLPEAILADRGELEGYAASNLVQSLGIRVANTSPYRADLKPIVERTFRSMNDLLIHQLPGAVRKPKERGERDPRLDAVLTLHEFRILMIHAVLQHNARRIEGYRLQKDMMTDGVQPRPVDLWAWGIQNRSGHLRKADPAIVRSNLLPGGKATVTHRGIKYRGLYYSCDRAMHERWHEKARASRSWQVDVNYDPRIVDTIFLRMPGVTSIEPCQLLEANQRFRGLSWPDVENFFLSQQEVREDSKTSDLQSRTNFRVQVETIVKNASREADAANRGLNKSARLRGVRKNRDEERSRDFAAAVGNAMNGPAKVPGNGNGDGSPLSDGHTTEAYVPPPSPLEMLRKQHESKWRIDE